MQNNTQKSKQSYIKQLDHIDLSKSDFDLSLHHQTDKDIFDLKVNVSEIDFFVLVKFCEERKMGYSIGQIEFWEDTEREAKEDFSNKEK